MGREESDRVKQLREELFLSERQLEKLKIEYGELNKGKPLNKKKLNEIKGKIKETTRRIDQKKELIMILGDDQFNSEHGDIFDRFLNKESGHLDDEVTRVDYPFHGIGLALFMELREKYYKFKKEKRN